MASTKSRDVAEYLVADKKEDRVVDDIQKKQSEDAHHGIISTSVGTNVAPAIQS
jgi:hypothetical protein